MYKELEKLTVRIDKRLKTEFFKICKEKEYVPSKVVRKMIKEFVEVEKQWKEDQKLL